MPGSFLQSVLANDLTRTVATAAPDITATHLLALVLLLQFAPDDAVGSSVRVTAWCRARPEVAL